MSTKKAFGRDNRIEKDQTVCNIYFLCVRFKTAMADNDLAYGKIFNGEYSEVTYPAKTILLNEGEVAKNIYRVENGCLRVYFVHEGKEVTFQFFFEGNVYCRLHPDTGIHTRHI